MIRARRWIADRLYSRYSISHWLDVNWNGGRERELKRFDRLIFDELHRYQDESRMRALHDLWERVHDPLDEGDYAAHQRADL